MVSLRLKTITVIVLAFVVGWGHEDLCARTAFDSTTIDKDIKALAEGTGQPELTAKVKTFVQLVNAIKSRHNNLTKPELETLAVRMYLDVTAPLKGITEKKMVNSFRNDMKKFCEQHQDLLSRLEAVVKRIDVTKDFNEDQALRTLKLIPQRDVAILVQKAGDVIAFFNTSAGQKICQVLRTKYLTPEERKQLDQLVA